MRLRNIIGISIISVAFICSTAAFAGKYKYKKKDSYAPKNVIVLISDGAGYNQVDAASYYQYGKTGMQVYEHFPTQLGMSTYMYGGSYDSDSAWSDFEYVKAGATDSAAAATSMSTGFKTYSGAIGLGMDRLPVEHIIELFEDLGKATGVVTSVEWTHATPAGFVAHNLSRNHYEAIGAEMIRDSATQLNKPAFIPTNGPSPREIKK